MSRFVGSCWCGRSAGFVCALVVGSGFWLVVLVCLVVGAGWLVGGFLAVVCCPFPSSDASWPRFTLFTLLLTLDILFAVFFTHLFLFIDLTGGMLVLPGQLSLF